MTHLDDIGWYDAAPTIAESQAGLATAAALATVDGYAAKVDDAETLGLLGVEDSLAYRVAEVERHHHAWENWFGAAASPSGETHVGDRLAAGVIAFQADAGNNAWGNWVQVLGSSDTPARVGMARYDCHRIFITDCERATAIHFIQIGFGDSGAAALTAGSYTEIVWKPGGVTSNESPMDILSRRRVAGTKAWVRVLVVGQDTGTLSFYLGLHEYEG